MGEDSSIGSIGVFDSGVGGLTVLNKLKENVSAQNYIYFGDTARIPYGEKSKEELININRAILDYYQSIGSKLVVMACNTSSAVALYEVEGDYDFKIFGMIDPVSRYLAFSDAKKIAVMATSATVKSQAYSKFIKRYSTSKEVLEVPCPGLVEIIEKNLLYNPEAQNLIKNYVDKALDFGAEKIVLGCTHYPFLTDIITEITGNKDMIINPADFVVERVLEFLEENNCENVENSRTKYMVSSAPEQFSKVVKAFIPDLDEVELFDVVSDTGVKI